MNAGSVCVVGSFMMDLAVRAPRRPQPGETLVGTSFDMFLGGKGFNQAIAAARAGARTTMIGRVGDDEFGSRFLDRLRSEGVDCTHVVVDGTLGTGIGAPLIEEAGENSIVIVPRANSRVSTDDIDRAGDAIRGADVLLLQLELPLETAVRAATIAKQSGVTVVLNPAPAPDEGAIERFRGLVDVVVPNEVEADALCGMPTGADHLTAGLRLADRLDAAVVVTAGARGCAVVARGTVRQIAAHHVEVVDTVGAGDAFCGALGAWLSAGTNLERAAVYANAAGALAVTHAGAEPAMPTSQQIDELVERAAAPARPGALTRQERERFARDGYLVREAVLTPDEIEAMRVACEQLCEELGAISDEQRKVDLSSYYVFETDASKNVMIKWEPGSRGVIQGIEPIVHLHPVLAEFGGHPSLTEPSRELLDVDAVSLYTEKLNVKRAGVGGAYALHRDLPYWVGASDDPEQMITVLLALDDTTVENGALEVLPGSHLIEDPPSRQSGLRFERNELDPDQMDTSGMVALEISAGSAVFFGPRLIHRSAPNRSDVDRRALLYTYQPAGFRDQRDNLRDWYGSG